MGTNINKDHRHIFFNELFLVILFAVFPWFGLILMELLPIYPVTLFFIDRGMATLLVYSAGMYFLAAIINAFTSYIASILIFLIIFPNENDHYRKLTMLLICSYLNPLSLAGMIKYSKYFKGFLWLLIPLAAVVGTLLVLGGFAFLRGVFKSQKMRIWSIATITIFGILVWHCYILYRFPSQALSFYVAIILAIAAAHIGIFIRAFRGSGTKVPCKWLGHAVFIIIFSLFIPLLSIIYNYFYNSIEIKTDIAPPHDQPNVVILLIDTLRADHCSLHGYPRQTTKFLSETIGSGYTVFNNGISQASSTTPSVKSLFTSRPASYYGPKSFSEPPLESELTLPLVFSKDGYKTACFSSNELIKGKGFENGFQGFLSWSGYFAARKIIAINNFLCQRDNMKFFEFIRKIRAHYPKGELLIHLIEKWLQTHKREAFFLYIHTLDPHWPYYSHDLNMIPEPYRKYEDELIYSELLDVETKDRADYYRERPDFFNLVGRYDEEICYSDHIINQLLDILKKQKIWDNTLFILTSDHGEEFLEHDNFSHGHDVWEELIHVPLIIKWPKRDAFHSMPQFIDAPVSLIDIMPTLIDYLGLTTSPPQTYGRSLRSVLENKDTPFETHLFSGCRYLDAFRAAYREGPLKLRIEFSTDISPMESSKLQVFDLAKDPEEKMQVPIDEPAISEFIIRGRDFWQEIWELWGDEERIESDPELKKELKQLKALGYI